MKFIAITSPNFIGNEPLLISELFEAGLDLLHFRKPGYEMKACARVIEDIPDWFHDRIIIHNDFQLCKEYGLRGVHLNAMNPHKPTDFPVSSVSKSCHSVADVVRCKPDVDYVFMSPIFNSISKPGYMSGYTLEELDETAALGIIDDKVIALGGVSLENIPMLKSWNFGGAALLGDIWKYDRSPDFESHAAAIADKLHSL